MRYSRLSLPLICCAAFVAGCGNSSTSRPAPPGMLALEEIATGIADPVHLTAPPGDDRLFVVEQAGRIRIIADDALLEAPFLDISDEVSSGGERGLLSLAFHPDYADNGQFYINFTDTGGNTRVVRYMVSDDPDLADPGSAALILQVDQPLPNHNGGHILFGPDGMLYIAMGDGGGAGDLQRHGQDPETLHGALLRIDVDGGEPYAIPPDNPYFGHEDNRGEIWAIGLRNPWRIAFDAAEGMLYIADVGQNQWEEVNAMPASEPGLNYGWNIMEGDECFSLLLPGVLPCDDEDLVLPVLTYATGEDGCAVVGGGVYRGSAIPGIVGHYFYSDFCGAWLRSFRLDGGEAVDRLEWELDVELGTVLSLGVDAAGEMYLLSGANDTVYRLVPGAG